MTQPSFGDAPGVTLFGVGGAGGNAVARLFRRADTGMKIISANTDMQALRAAPSASQLQLGRTLTRGLGAGANPEIGRAAAEEALARDRPGARRVRRCASLPPGWAAARVPAPHR